MLDDIALKKMFFAPEARWKLAGGCGFASTTG
jgi:hypothetical protein